MEISYSVSVMRRMPSTSSSGENSTYRPLRATDHNRWPTFRGGNIFGEMGLIQNLSRHATVAAVGKGKNELVRIPDQAFLSLLNRDPGSPGRMAANLDTPLQIAELLAFSSRGATFET